MRNRWWPAILIVIYIHQGSVLASEPYLSPEFDLVGAGHYESRNLAITFNETGFLTVWDERNRQRDVYAVRSTSDGSVLDPTGIVISSTPETQQWSSVSADGVNYFVVWSDYRDSVNATDGENYSNIYGARVSKEGLVLDTAGLKINAAVKGQHSPVIAFDGTNYLIVWNDYRSGAGRIYGARVGVNGMLLDQIEIEISVGEEGRGAPTIVYGDSQYFVAWVDSRNFSDDKAYHDIYGARISKEGILLDSQGIAICQSVNYQEAPALAFDGENYLVVWQDSRADTEDGYAVNTSDIYGTRVTPQGVVLDPQGLPIAVGVTLGHKRSPVVAFDGVNYIIVWEESDYAMMLPGIYGTVVSPAGTKTEDRFILALNATPRNPAIASDGKGRTMAAYEKGDMIAARIIYTLPLGADCSLDDQCESEFCVFGRCVSAEEADSDSLFGEEKTPDDDTMPDSDLSYPIKPKNDGCSCSVVF